MSTFSSWILLVGAIDCNTHVAGGLKFGGNIIQFWT